MRIQSCDEKGSERNADYRKVVIRFLLCLGIGLLEAGYSLQLILPSPLKLRGDQMVVRPHRVILPLLQSCFVSRLLQLHPPKDLLLNSFGEPFSKV